MGTNELILTKTQAAFESVRGTDLATTRIVYAKNMPKYEKSLMEFQDMSGTFFDRRRAAYAREKVSFTMNDILTFEDAPWWFEQFIRGGVSPVADAGSPIAYTRTYAPSASTDDLKSCTYEFNEAGNVYKTNQVMVTQASLRMDSDNDSEPGWMADIEQIGIGWTPSTYTAAIPQRTTEVILARGTKLFIDDAGGTLGTTQKLGSLISASITINTGIHFKAFSENATGFAPGKVGRQAYRVDAQFTFEFDSDAEFAKYRNSQPQARLIRLSSEGSQIHGSPAVNKLLQIDFPNGIWSSWSRGDREGNLTATFGMSAFYDATAANIISVKTINALVTLP